MHQIKVNHFSLDQIMRSGQCFRMKQIDSNKYEIIAGSRYLIADQQSNLLTLHCNKEELDFWYDYFDLNTDYGVYIDRLNPNDSYLMKAVAASDGVRILKQDLWEMIVTFLVSQQNHIKRIRRCIELLCNKYGEPFTLDGTFCPEPANVKPDNKLNCGRHIPEVKGYHSFPRPEAFAGLNEDALMDCNLGYRSKYVVRSARQILEGEVNLEEIEKLPYKKAKEELLKLFGVGEKVADCICLFARHDLDAFPVDTHIRQALDQHYKRGFPNRRYKGFRGVVQQYIFYYELMGS